MSHALFTRRTIPHLVSALVLSAVAVPSLMADDWPQWLGPQRDGVWREKGIVESFPKTGLPVRWRTPVGPGYSGPAVSEGKVFLLDRQPERDAEGKDVALADGSLPGKERVFAL